jgi:hypothetical protein
MTSAAPVSMSPDGAWPARPEEKIATLAPIGVSTFEAIDAGYQSDYTFNTGRCHAPAAKTAHCRRGAYARTVTPTGVAVILSPPAPLPQPNISHVDSPRPLSSPRPATVPLPAEAQPAIATATITVTRQSPDHSPKARINGRFTTRFHAHFLPDTFALRECGPAATAGVSVR